MKQGKEMTPTTHIEIMRLSQRDYRDLRITTHCALVGRAFGAEKIYLETSAAEEIEKTVSKINHQFGGTFTVEQVDKPTTLLKKRKKEGYCIVHLTMYGSTLLSNVPKIKKKKKMVIVIGSDKVPAEIYHLADYNISVTNQPHSEVAALAVFLHEIQGGKEENIVFEGAKQTVVPQARGKKVMHFPHE